jgi:hypothetical protein
MVGWSYIHKRTSQAPTVEVILHSQCTSLGSGRLAVPPRRRGLREEALRSTNALEVDGEFCREALRFGDAPTRAWQRC